jgi:hypothetical protein
MKGFYEVATDSIIEIDAALDVAAELGYTSKEKLNGLGQFMIRSFQMLSKMI